MRLFTFLALATLSLPAWGYPPSVALPPRAPAKDAKHTKPAPKATLSPSLTPQATLPAPSAVTLPFQLGITQLKAQGFAPLVGRRVGLLTHTAAVDENGTLTVDILRAAPGVQLVALFGPEHGLTRLSKADEKVDDSTYQGIPVYSLYGPTRQPTPQMLKGLDVMNVDLQDIGVRSYTYISALKLTLQACFQAGIPVMVLDRPNPLGGQKVDGPLLDPRFKSYVGSYRMPYIHGLTIGEVALLAQDEIKPLKGSLSIVKMQGWHRRMLWSDTGLKWRATSPSVPTLAAAFGYACTGLGAQLGGFRHGYGTEYPFRFLSHPRLSPPQLRARLSEAHIPGVSFDVLTIPQGLRGAGQQGVYVRIQNWHNAGAIQLSLTMLQICQELDGNKSFVAASGNDEDLFNKHWGRAEPLRTLQGRQRLNAWKLSRHWQAEATRWQQWARQFWLYT